MFCSHCGTGIKDGARFCQECGQSVPLKTEGFVNKPIKETQPLLHKKVHGKDIAHDNLLRKNGAAPLKKKKLYLGILVAAILLIGLGVGSAFLKNSNSSKPVSAVTKKETESSKSAAKFKKALPPTLSNGQFSALFPDWELLKQETVTINDKYYTILGVQQNGNYSSKVVIVKYDTDTKEWVVNWETEEYTEVEKVDEFVVLNPPSEKKALVVFNLNHGGNSGVYTTKAIEVSENGIGDVSWEGQGTHIEKKGERAVVHDLGEIYLSIKDSQLKVDTVPRSDAGPSNAVKARFKMDRGKVVPTENMELNLKVGDIVSFIPSNTEAKRNYDDGSIMVYTNLGNGGPVSTIHAMQWYGGNKFKLTEPGTFEFLLDYYNEQSEDSYEEPAATFVVHVSRDGKSPDYSDRKVETKEELKNVLDSALTYGQLGPFNVNLNGKDLNYLKKQFGEPDDLFLSDCTDCDSFDVAHYGDYGFNMGEQVFGVWVHAKVGQSEVEQLLGMTGTVDYGMDGEYYIYENGSYRLSVIYGKENKECWITVERPSF